MGASLRALYGATLILLVRLSQLGGESEDKETLFHLDQMILQKQFRKPKISEINFKIQLH